MKRIILILAILIPFTLFGQAELRKGYIATQNGDTVSCLYINGQWVLESDVTFVIEVDSIVYSDGTKSYTAQGNAVIPFNYSYTFDPITTDSRPGPGNFRLNSPTYSNVTEIYIDIIDGNSIDKSITLNIADTGSYVYITDGINYIVYQRTGDLVNAGLYYKYGVTYIGNSGVISGGCTISVDLSNNNKTELTSDFITLTAQRATIDTVEVPSTEGDSPLYIYNDISAQIYANNKDIIIGADEGLDSVSSRIRFYTQNEILFTDYPAQRGFSFFYNGTPDVLYPSTTLWRSLTDTLATRADVRSQGGGGAIDSLFHADTHEWLSNLDTIPKADSNRVKFTGDTLLVETIRPKSSDINIEALDALNMSSSSINNVTVGNYNITSGSNTYSFENDTARFEEENIKVKTITVGDSIQHADGTWIVGTIEANLIVETIKTRFLTVDKDVDRGLFSTIEDAIDSINTTGSDSLNRWVVEVGVGFFNENTPLIIPEYTTIRSSAELGVSVVVPNNETDVFKLSDFTSVSGLSIVNAQTAFAFDNPNSSSRVTNCIINSCDTGLSVTSGVVFASDIFIASENTKTNVGVYNSGGNLTIAGININNADTVDVIFELSGGSSITTINNLITFSNNVDTVLHATDTANAVINNSSIVFAKNGLISENYSSVRFNGGSHFNISETYKYQDENSILAGFANTDQNDIAVELIGQEFHVGSPEEGFEVTIGEGDSYSDRMLVYTSDQLEEINVTDSARYADGKGFSLPGTGTQNAIYIASDIDTLIHHGLKIVMIDSMTIGSGEIVLEYWNGSAWTEFNGMVKDSDSPYAYHAKSYLEQSQGTHILYDINVTNDNWTASNPIGAGTRKWVRFYVTSAITSVPKIDQIKLHPSRTEINKDGALESFGNARYTQILQLNIGSGEPFEGNMQSQTIYVDENIGVGFQSNRFTATGDKLGFPLNFPDNIDTSSPISFVWSGRATNAATIEWTVRWVLVSPTSTLYTIEPAASGNAYSTTTSTTTVIGDNELFSVELDISEAIPSRAGSFGDQLWISIQPTTLSGSFDLTNVGAEYWAHILGGHK